MTSQTLEAFVMQITSVELPDLFTQLGLPNSDLAIARFIKNHSLPEGVPLALADFWTKSQQQFLDESWHQDSDWCVPIDKLDALLRH
jgi:hypothetical protein